MRVFIFKQENKSDKRGCNMTITVYEIIDGMPSFVAVENNINTASWTGARATAMGIVAIIYNIDFNGYEFFNVGDIEVLEV